MFSCLNEICEIGEGESLPLNLKNMKKNDIIKSLKRLNLVKNGTKKQFELLQKSINKK